MIESPKRESWRSRMGFIMAAAGSAVGLANIWRFPYIVGNNGGAAFIFCYLICLLIIGLPVFLAELLIGKQTQRSPAEAFPMLGGSKIWGWIGKATIFTGFIVSAFYSAIAGLIFGYLIEAFKGNITSLSTGDLAGRHYQILVSDPFWAVGFQVLFLVCCFVILMFGVRDGIERGSKILMPLLFAILLCLAIRGIMLPGSGRGLLFLLTPDWSKITPLVLLTALGQSFFTLSLGQGTMVTYGSYLRKEDSVIGSSLSVAGMDTLVSLLASVAIMTVVFSAGVLPTQGPSLLFQTLPIVFSQTSGGYFLAIGFFLLVTIAAITSEISAMEPTISYLVDRGWNRKKATILCSIGVLLVGVPCALSFGVLSDFTFFGKNIFDILVSAMLDFMVPLGGLAAVLCVSWFWGIAKTIEALDQKRESFAGRVLVFSLKYSTPVLIIIVFLHAILG